MVNSPYECHWVIGDVHGCYESLWQLLEVLPSSAQLVFCGDVINRGPAIEATMLLVWELVCNGRATWLRGNHEQHLINCLEADHPDGRAALLAIDTYRQLGDDLAREWLGRLKELPLVYKAKEWIATHAGLDLNGNPDLSIRKRFWEDYDGRYGRVVVAHTPRPQVELHRHIVMIDTGACYGGLLSAYCPERDEVVQVCGDHRLKKRYSADLNKLKEALPRETTTSSSLVSVKPC